MNPIDDKPVFPIYGGHVACMCAQSVALNIRVYPNSSKPFTQRRPIWVISGTSKTNREGLDILNINIYLQHPICEINDNYSHLQPAIINDQPAMITTPQSSTPVLLTTVSKVTKRAYSPGFLNVIDHSRVERQNLEYDVSFEVRSWTLDGNPAKSTNFSWICFAEAALRIEPLM